MTASTKPKTPSMTMIVSEDVSPTDIETFCKKASRLTLSQVVDTVVVKERLKVSGGSRSKDFTIDISFYPLEEYSAEYDVESSEILAAFGTRFPLILKKEIQTELKKLDSDLKMQIGKGKAENVKAGAGGEDDAEGNSGDMPDRDDASEHGDGDADEVKQAGKRKEMATYDDDDSDEDLDEDAIEAKFASKDDEDEEDVDAVDPEVSDRKKGAKVESLFMDNCPFAQSFKFSPKGCKIGLSVSCKVQDYSHAKLFLVPIFNTKTASCWCGGENMCQDCCSRDPRHSGLFHNEGRRE